MYGCALLWYLYAHCIRHSPVLQVYTFCTACILLCAKVVTGCTNVVDCTTYIEGLHHFDHVLHFMHTYSELPEKTLENCTHKMVYGL